MRSFATLTRVHVLGECFVNCLSGEWIGLILRLVTRILELIVHVNIVCFSIIAVVSIALIFGYRSLTYHLLPTI